MKRKHEKGEGREGKGKATCRGCTLDATDIHLDYGGRMLESGPRILPPRAVFAKRRLFT